MRPTRDRAESYSRASRYSFHRQKEKWWPNESRKRNHLLTQPSMTRSEWAGTSPLAAPPSRGEEENEWPEKFAEGGLHVMEAL
jgi:hypothetical protein